MIPKPLSFSLTLINPKNSNYTPRLQSQRQPQPTIARERRDMAIVGKGVLPSPATPGHSVSQPAVLITIIIPSQMTAFTQGSPAGVCKLQLGLKTHQDISAQPWMSRFTDFLPLCGDYLGSKLQPGKRLLQLTVPPHVSLQRKTGRRTSPPTHFCRGNTPSSPALDQDP